MLYCSKICNCPALEPELSMGRGAAFCSGACAGTAGGEVGKGPWMTALFYSMRGAIPALLYFALRWRWPLRPRQQLSIIVVVIGSGIATSSIYLRAGRRCRAGQPCKNACMHARTPLLPLLEPFPVAEERTYTGARAHTRTHLPNQGTQANSVFVR